MLLGTLLLAGGCAADGERAGDVETDQVSGQEAGDLASDPEGDRYASADKAPANAMSDTRDDDARTGGTAGRGSWDAPMESTSREPERSTATVIRTVPAGETLNVVLLDDLSSAVNQSGDSFRARVSDDVVVDGDVAIPAGSVVRGTVVEVVGLNKRIGGQAKLVLDFDRLELPSGRTASIAARFSEIGKSETRKDAATIAGGAAAGAILGRVLKDDDRKKGTLIGAVVGAATGTAVAARTQGEEVQIVAGTPMALQLESSVQVPVRL